MAGERILIVGAAGWKNVGDDLIAESIVEWVEGSGGRAQVVGGPYAHVSGGSSPLFLSGKFADNLKVIGAVLACDYVVIGGGGLLDDRSPKFYRPFTRIAALCRLVRRKYAFVGIGVGPVQHEGTGKAYFNAVQGADRVLVRDTASKERLSDAGVTREVEIVNDPVLWTLEESSNVGPNADLVVNLRNWHSEDDPRLGYAGPSNHDIVEAVAEAINATHGSGSHVALVSMSGIADDNDAVLLEELKPRLRATVTTHYTHSPQDVTSTVTGAKMVLSMRLHACLLGAAHRKKVVGLAYDPKVTAQSKVHGFTAVSLDPGFMARGKEALREALVAATVATPKDGTPAPLWEIDGNAGNGRKPSWRSSLDGPIRSFRTWQGRFR